MRLLIVSASVGSGHVRAAAALEEAAHELYPEFTIRNEDILRHTSAPYRALYAGSYLQLTNRTPLLWGYLYDRFDFAKAAKRQPRIVELFDAFEFKKFRAMVSEYAPDIVMSTHFLPLQIYEPYRRSGKVSWPLVVALTDFDAHVLWAQFTADRFFVATDEVAEVLAAKGLQRQKMTTVGIPISPAFSKPVDRAAVRKVLGLRDGPPTMLVMGGAYGQGTLLETVRSALDAAPVQIIAVAGRNEAARRKLEALRVPQGRTLKVFGYVNNVHELMAVSDLVVTKAGALTVAECLATGVPMLIPDAVPGQEKRNCSYAVECGAALSCEGVGALRYKLKLLLEDASLRARLAAGAKACGRPNAARTVIAAAVEMLVRRPQNA